MKSPGWLPPLLLAVFLAGVNAAKPLHIDDTQYFDYASHIAEHPSDPYGFEVLWFQWPEPAIELLNPLGLPYWLAGHFAVFGADAIVAKLSLFPFLLLFSFGVAGLLRRFVGVHETALLWAVGLSPAVMPGINLMLDLPALALVLCALNVFFDACESGSAVRAAAAGALTGLAMQTKYSALAGPGIMLLYAWVRGQLPLGLLAGVMAASVFGLWEAAIVARYGRSHFWIQLLIDDPFQRDISKWAMVLPLVANAGAVACPAALLGVAGLASRPTVWVLGLGAAILAMYASLWWGPTGLVVFVVLGLFVWGTAFSMSRRLWAGWGGFAAALRPGGPHPESRFLVAWLGLEIVAYFVLAPFPAARRMTVLFLVMWLLAGRLIAARPTPERAMLVRTVAGMTAALGLLYFGVDWLEARAHREAATRAAERVRVASPEARAWFVGHWGFQHHAVQAGMRPVVPDRSELRPGDGLVIHTGVPRQALAGDPALERIDRIVVDDRVPLAMVPDYYAGVWPLHHRDRPRAELVLMRATADLIPRTGLPTQTVIDWARERAGPTALVAVPALLEIVRSGAPAERREAEAVLRELTPALREAVAGSEPFARENARRALSLLEGADG